MTGQVMLPNWVTPAAGQVRDLHTVATANQSELAAGCRDAIAWIADPAGPTAEQAQAETVELDKRRREGPYWVGIADTLAWLNGWLSQPPLEVPRRNPDGTVLTGDQLYAELLDAYPAGWQPTPEQRHTARQQADVTAARWARLV